MTAVWLSLAVLVVCLAAGGWHVFVRTRDALRALRGLGDAVSEALARVDEAAARMSESAALAPDSGAKLEPSLERLARSRAQLAALTAAIGEAAELGRGVRRLVSRK